MSLTIPRPPRWVAVALAGLAVALGSGCAKMGKVSGKVTQEDGSPLPGGVISFLPEDSGANPATANLNEDGTYEVDVPVGNCKVSIDNRGAGQTMTLIGRGGMPTKIGNPPADDGKEKDKKGGPMGGKMAMMKGKGGKDAAAPPVPKDAKQQLDQMGGDGPTTVTPVAGKAVPINPKYYTPDSSGLTFKVGGGSNTFDVKVTK